MASNTLDGVNLAKIAQQSIDALTTELISLRSIAMDFSSEIASEGESVTTRFPTAPVTKDASGTRSSSNSTTTKRTITLDQFRMFDIGFNDLEVTKSSIRLRELFIEPGVVALAEDLMASIFGLMTAANFAQSVTLTSGQYDADAVANLAQLMSTAKVRKRPRGAVVPPTYYETLNTDNAIQNQQASGTTQPVIEGVIPRVHGIDQYEYTGTIPNNGENLAGFVAGPQGVLMAARQVAPPMDWYGRVVTVVEPMTGLPVQFRWFYDGVEHRLQAIILYGVQIGNAGNVYRIVSA